MPAERAPIAPERSVGATLTLLLGAAVAVAAVAPGAVLVLAAGWLLVGRVADRTMAATAYRRSTHGRRGSDPAVAVAALPWRALASIPWALLAAVLPISLAVCAAFIAGAAADPMSPRPQSQGALAAAALTGLSAAWFGPGGGAVRRPTRRAALGLGRRPRLRRAVRVLLVLLAVSGVLVALGGAAPDWAPLSGSPHLPALPAPTLPLP
jgi:hypothetical protein